MKKKILIPIVVLAIAIGSVLMITINKKTATTATTTSQRVATADELLALKADTEDRGIIREYSTPSGVNENFNITYVNEQGKVEYTSLKHLYVIGNVEKFEGTTILVKKFNNNILTNDQIKILSYSLNQDQVSSEKMVESMMKGTTIEVGFIIEKTTK